MDAKAKKWASESCGEEGEDWFEGESWLDFDSAEQGGENTVG